ncbi:CD81 antigen-like [Xyrauchen texanus]|uniref:CD81 antigen-like n=1 Tax=Xyrauchen texanus TaxID=154827 RepID=UPI002241FC98|nr:CD81 antigen-like [Xyrauchen texanus]
MGVEGCTKCIKYMLFFLNFFFWLSGCVILGVSLWVRHDTKTSSILNQRFEQTVAPSTFYISVYTLIAIGAVMMFVGFIGCYGAIQESQCLLGTFFACLVILFACEVAAGIWGFMNKDKISKELITFYDSVYDSAMSHSDAEKRKPAAAVLKVFHDSLNCCGKGVSTGLVSWFSDMCPKQIELTNSSCHSKINELFSEKVYLIGIAALVVAVIMIFEMIFSMVLCCGIRNSPVY